MKKVKLHPITIEIEEKRVPFYKDIYFQLGMIFAIFVIIFAINYLAIREVIRLYPREVKQNEVNR